MKHSATSETPAKAAKKENERLAHKTRKYSPLRVGGEVKIFREKAIAEKENGSIIKITKLLRLNTSPQILGKNSVKQVRGSDCICDLIYQKRIVRKYFKRYYRLSNKMLFN